MAGAHSQWALVFCLSKTLRDGVANAEFIAAARTALPKLLDEISRRGVDAVTASAEHSARKHSVDTLVRERDIYCQERDEARAQVEHLRSSVYELETLVHTRTQERDDARSKQLSADRSVPMRHLRERDEARAEVERLRKSLHGHENHTAECDRYGQQFCGPVECGCWDYGDD